jgi:hydroxymethylglutaryl-CoA lyase
MGEQVRIIEVGLRDGLQNERAPITTEHKLAMADGLLKAGLRHLEVTSFVSPKAVPMMADATQVMRHVRQSAPDAHAMGLIFNDKGLDSALEADCRAIGLVLIVSDSLSKSNSGRTPDEWLEAYRALIARAKAHGVWVRGYVAGAWVCPFEGQVPLERVLRYADFLWEQGVDELCPTDPIGHAHPLQVGALCEAFARRYDVGRVAVHLHDTQALGLANATAALSAGIRRFDTSVGGLGGCPFAPGAAGNLATEDFVLMAHKMGYETGVNFDALWDVIAQLEPLMGRRIGGRVRAWRDSTCKDESAS